MRRSIVVCVVLAGLAAAAAASAQVHPPENVVLLKNLDRGEQYAGNWGYTAPDGTELAISGTRTGTTFINATDPVNAYEVAFIPAPSSTWREMATLGRYCYIVTEASGAALQVVDLIDPLHPTLVATLNPPTFFYARAHEIKADPATGFLYVAGTSPGTGQPSRGLVILDTNGSPTNPTLRGTWTVDYVHDLSIRNGTAYAGSVYPPATVYVLDVRNAGTPPILAQWTYPGASTHNTWPSDDGNYLVTTDEVTGFTLKMWDIRNLPSVAQTDDFASPTGAVVHNAYLRGNLCYVAWYRDGLRVFDVSDPWDIRPVGWYDTHIQDGQGYDGAWGCYCFARDPAIAYISDMQSGTFILRFTGATTGVGDPDLAAGAGRPALRGNYPNPFHPQTAIRFDLTVATPVRIRIFDAAGRTVRMLADDRRFGPGSQSVTWDGRNDGAEPVASGVYYYRLEAPGYSAVRSMVLAK